ncbi:TonB-linked outer membrane protein, SusC/RagA family [bacterium A37T11]|nr:TonB-linked outer membrane protein, SusC/RagA family [bacterium A37T11]
MKKYVLQSVGLTKPMAKHQLFLIMKITSVLLLVGCLHVSAASLSQTITLQSKNMPITDVFAAIEDQTGYMVLYNSQVVKFAKPVSMNVAHMELDDFLKLLVKDQSFSFDINEKTILVAKRGGNVVTGFSVVNVPVQQTEVKGKITDEKGQPMAGVTVTIKGTTKTVASNENGTYEIALSAPKDVLVFTMVGYKTVEKVASAGPMIDVVMVEELSNLDEVVVVGYGSQSRATVTGSIASVSNKEINTSTNGNVVNNLAGKLPGLRVTQRTGEPGDYATDFDIRGFGAPLIVVDGVPRSTFNRLDPAEIESISVLKDASAAVYGVKGGNGVILITTKRGGNGKTQFNLSSTFGATTPSNAPHTLDAYQYAVLTDESYLNAGNNNLPFSQEDIAKYKDGTLPSTDWYNLVVRKYSPVQQHNISASGSTDKVKYFLSLGYYGEQGMWKSGDLDAKRYNFRSNLTANLTKDLQAEVLLNGIIDSKNSPSETTYPIMQSLWRQIPTTSVFANDNPAYFNNTFDAAHPLAITNSDISGYDDRTTKTFNGSFALNYKIPAVQGLKLRALFAYDNDYGINKVWKKAFNVYNYDPITDAYTIAGTRNAPSNLTQAYSENTSTTAQLSMEYENTFNLNHHVKGLLLGEERKYNGTGFNGHREFSLDAVDQLYAGNSLNQSTTSSNIDPNVNEGLVGRLNYDYSGRYLLEGSFRYDGSSKFAEGHKWGFFPAVSAGWRISEEPFLKNKFGFVQNLKLRASYGKLGDDGSSTYQYLMGYNYPNSNYVFGNSLVNGLGFRGMSNQNLTWYTSTLINVGLDADLFNNKLHTEVDVFSKKRVGLLATRNLSLPGTVGAGLPQENLNSDQTLGLELTLSHSNKIGEVAYNISGNVSFTRTKNLYVERAASKNSYRNWRDNNAYRWNDNYFGLKVISQFTSMDEIKNSPIEDGNGNRNVLPGDLKYEDLNKDGIIDGDDWQNVGRNSHTPEINFGLTLNVQWKGFDINALFQGATNYTVSYLGSVALDGPLAWGGNGLDVFMDRWHKADLFDPNSAWIPGKYPSTRTKSGTTTSAEWNYQPSDFWLKDATYLRLKSLQIGYTFPANMFKSTDIIKSLRVYINGFDLFTWSGLNSLIDPEHTNDSYGNKYPTITSYNFGIDLTF